MPPKPQGDRPASGAERQARYRERQAQQQDAKRLALERILQAKTKREAQRIAAEALMPSSSDT